jgi:hypothetical protein
MAPVKLRGKTTMGYTHYWTQKRNFTVAQWQDICGDIRAILDYSQNLAGIPLADGMGEGGTKPEISDDLISFNGLGDDSRGVGTDRQRSQVEWPDKNRIDPRHIQDGVEVVMQSTVAFAVSGSCQVFLDDCFGYAAVGLSARLMDYWEDQICLRETRRVCWHTDSHGT